MWTSPCGAPTRHYQGRNRETITWAEAAIADAEASGDPSLLATAHLHLELAHSMLGDGLAAGHGTKAVALFEAAGDRTGLTHALINNGLTAYDEGRWADALDAYRRAGDAAATTGNVTQRALAAMNSAFVLVELGQVDDAAERCAAARRAFAASGNELFLAYTDMLSSRIALWAGDHDAARTHLAAARQRFEAVGSRQMVLDCDVVAVEVALHAGDDPAAVLVDARRTVAEVDAFGPAELLPTTSRRLLARAAALAGAGDEAVAVAHLAVETARDHGARFELALCLDALAHAHRCAGSDPDPALLTERDAILTTLGVQRTLTPRTH